MIQRSKIRQSALQFLYATLQSGEQSITRDLFWSIAQEKQQSHFINALAKALLHAGRYAPQSFDAFEAAVEPALSELAVDGLTITLREALERYNKNAQNLQIALNSLKLTLNDKRKDDMDELYDSCKDILHMVQVAQGLVKEYRIYPVDFPQYKKELSAVESALKKLDRLYSSVGQLSDIKQLPVQGEFKGLVIAYNEIEELRPEVEALALPVLDRMGEWDELITPLLKHYSIERLDILDRCILYISLYELLENKLPLAVVISEATALAHSYSGSKSAPFIHGVLAAAAPKES